MPAVQSAATIVGLGKFEPDFFRLDSLVASRLLSGAEANRAKIEALLPSRVVHFTLPWGELLVLGDRFQMTATEAPFIRVADLFIQAVKMMGERCNVQAFGVNYEAHFDVGSMAARDALAMRFAPPDAWGEWGRSVRASMESENAEVHGGLAILTMREAFRTGDICGWYDVSLSHSEKVPNSAGVRLAMNHHHEYAPRSTSSSEQPGAKDDATRRTEAMLSALVAEFDESIGKAERIFAEVLG